MKMKLYTLSILLSFIGLLFSCDQKQIPIAERTIDVTPNIYPAYEAATLPPNIAPLNFKVQDEGSEWIIEIKGKQESIIINTKNFVDLPIKPWKKLLSENQGETIYVTVFSKIDNKWTQYKPFSWEISPDSIDNYVAYRLIEPTYANWNGMEICQRNLSNFDETEIISNKKSGHNCINCHTFNQGNPNEMVLHMRKINAGTLLIQNGKCQKLSTKTPHTISNFVYPYWHPSGNQIAFSTNLTQMSFYDANPKIIEVYDAQSDIIMYDINKNEVYTSPLLSDPDKLENFPFFSPNGEQLYFCSCNKVDSMPQQYADVKYRICSIDFDQEHNLFGTQIDTLIDLTAEKKGVTLPSISPDGRFIACSVTPSGCFTSWIPQSDLYLYNIYDKKIYPATEWNSERSESCTTWSSNSRWVIFCSRRDDGIYNRLYIAHIDKQGKLSKPFILPQKDPNFNQMNMKAYNLPRLITGKVTISPVTIGRCAESSKEKSVRFNDKQHKPIIKQATDNSSEIN